MLEKQLFSILKFYAVSPVHAGSGSSVATVDLPIQRERHTGYPIIQSSGVKGAMRDHFRKFHDASNDKELINKIFGSDEQDGWDKNKESIPGAFTVSDAKILAFPIRSNVAPFVWVTSPTVLNRLKKDLEYIGGGINDTFEVEGDKAIILEGSFRNGQKIILEEAVVKVSGDKPQHIDFLRNYFPELERLLLISDEMFDYCVSYCTEIQTNIKIDSEKGTTKDGSLRYQEFLPSDSVLYSVVKFGKSYEGDLQSDTIKKFLQDTITGFIQVGGDTSMGKGICKINWINNDGGNK